MRMHNVFVPVALAALLLATSSVAAPTPKVQDAEIPAPSAPAQEFKTAPAEPCGGALQFMKRLDRHEPVEKRVFESGYRWRAYLAARALAALDRMAQVNPDWKKTAAAFCDGMLDQVRKDVTPMARRDVADALFVLGCAAYLQRDYLPAAQVFSDAVTLDRKNPDYLAALGHMHTLAQDHRTAAPLLAAAWKEEERVSGRTAVAGWLAENVADAHRSVGDAAFAAQVAEEAESIYSRALGPDAVQVGMARARKGSALLDANRTEEAEAALRSALDLFMKVCGPDTPVVAEVLRSLGIVRSMRNEREEAAELFGAALVSAANWYGLEAPDLSPYLAPMGILRYQAGKYDEAIELLRDARNGAIALYGYEAPEVEELEGWIKLCEDAKIRGVLPGGNAPTTPGAAAAKDPLVKQPVQREAVPGFTLDKSLGDMPDAAPGSEGGATGMTSPMGPARQ